MIHDPLDLHAFGGVVLVADQVALAVSILALVVGGASLVVRFRRARGTERQQLRWVALAAVPVVLAAGGVLAAAATGTGVVADVAGDVCAAVARYRLYDLDRIVSRTLAYGLLTVLLGGGYAVAVLGLGQLVGRQSSLAVAVATLAVAGVFQPARRRVQGLVDRRFNRRRYDAARTIAAFAARLRQQVDLDSLAAELLAVVDQTMQPTRVSLWLRPPPPSSAPNRSAAAAPDRAASQRR